MELRQLRYFLVVMAEGSLTRAAQRLHITQPALSRQIQQLEKESGARLLERTPKGVEPTPAGTALHGHALRILRLADSTREVTTSATPSKETVALGLAPGLPAEWLGDRLRPLLAEESPVHLDITDASSTELLKMTGEGSLDLAIVHQDPPATMHRHRVLERPFGLAVRPTHPLGTATSCSLQDLDGLRVLAHAREQVPSEYDRLLASAHEAGVSPMWQFARFTENALLCAETSQSMGIVLNETTAARLVPEWPWLPLTGPEINQHTWLAWPTTTRSIVNRVAELLTEGQNDTANLRSVAAALDP